MFWVQSPEGGIHFIQNIHYLFDLIFIFIGLSSGFLESTHVDSCIAAVVVRDSCHVALEQNQQTAHHVTSLDPRPTEKL